MAVLISSWDYIHAYWLGYESKEACAQLK